MMEVLFQAFSLIVDHTHDRNLKFEICILYLTISYAIVTFRRAYSSIIFLCCNAAIPTLHMINLINNVIFLMLH